MLTIFRCVLNCRALFAGGAEKELKHIAQEFCHDETLFASHPAIHQELVLLSSESSRQEEACVLLEQVRQAVAFLRDKSATCDGARGALQFLSMHESRRTVPLVLQLCRTDQDAHKISAMVLHLLQSPDLQLQTTAYLELHRVVQESLGVAAALSAEVAPAENALSVISNPVVFREISEGGLFHRSAHIRKACEEIFVYGLKSKLHVGDASWLKFKGTLCHFLPVLECCVGEDGNLFAKNLQRSVAQGDGKIELSLGDRLRVSLRMLFSRRPQVRNDALVNLKFLLSRQEASSELQPKFGSILETTTSAHMFVNQRKTNLICGGIPTAAEMLDSSYESSSASLAVVTKALSGQCSTDQDVKFALSQLEMLLQDSKIGEDFVISRRGVGLLANVLKTCLKKETVSVGVLAAAVLAAKTLLSKSDLAMEQVHSNESMLFSLTRCLFVKVDDPMFVSDLAVVLVLALYSDFVLVTPSQAPQVNGVVAQCIHVPFDHVPKSLIPDGSLVQRKVPIEGFPMIKTAWNIAWYGGLEEAINSAELGYPDFSPNLQMSEVERELLKHSFCETGAKFGIELIKGAQCHEDFLDGLDYLKTMDEVSTVSEELRPVFQRFLVKTPHAFAADRRIFVEMADFILQCLLTEKTKSEQLETWIGGLCSNFQMFELLSSGCDMGLWEMDVINGLYTACEDKIALLPKCFAEWNCSLLRRHTFAALDTVIDALESGAYWPDCELALVLEEVHKKLGEFLPSSSYEHKTTVLKLLNLCHVVGIRKMSDGNLLLPPLGLFLPGGLLNKINIPEVNASTLQVICSRLRRKNNTDCGKAKDQAQANMLWETTLKMVMDERESHLVRLQAANVIISLVSKREESAPCWLYGPVVQERISGMTIMGEDALSALLRQTSFETFIVKRLKRCSSDDFVFAVPDLLVTSKILNLSVAFSKADPACVSGEKVLVALLESTVDYSNRDVTLPREHLSVLADALGATLSSVVHFMRHVAGAKGIVSKNIGAVAMLTSSVLHMWDSLGGERDARTRNVFLPLADVLSQVYSSGFMDGHKRLHVMAKYVGPMAKRCLKLLQTSNSHHDSSSLKLCRVIESLCSAMIEERHLLGISHTAIKLNSEKDGRSSFFERLCQELLGGLLSAQSLALPVGNLSDVIHCRALCGVFSLSFAAQDIALRSDILETVQHHLDEIRKRVSRSKSRDSLSDDLAYVGLLLSLINNLSHENKTVKTHLAVKTSLLGQLHCLHPYFDNGVLATYVQFLTFLCIDCHPARCSLVTAQKAAESREMKRRGSSLDLVLELVGQNAMPPNAPFRLLMVAVESSECRKFVARSEVFLDQCRLILALGNQKKSLEVLLLDLLLAMSFHKDGQTKLGETIMIDLIVPFAAADCRTQGARRMALALLRNLSLTSMNRVKLLQSDEFLQLVADSIEREKSNVLPVLLWALAANNARAKQTLKKAGIIDAFKRKYEQDVSKLIRTVSSVFA
jgi:hypothetical protein